MDVVRTDSGYISGTVLGEPDKPVSVFRGIPYAAPPVGELRWKPPQPATPWRGIRECTRFSAVAPQTVIGFDATFGLPQSEDCLYVNVLTPASKAADKLPVMVWMHGGGYATVHGNDNGVNGARLPQEGVVLVTVNTRLGPLGCLAHPALSKESPIGVSGNYLFLDMVAALQWVHENIAAFGGSPDNVTVFGESGGSGKVINLMASPLAKGLFQRAIGQSGSGLGTPLKGAEAIGERIFAKLGADKAADPLAAARALPSQRLIEAGEAVAADLRMPAGIWDSVVDGWFLMDTPANTFKAGKQNTVPFILGANLGELTGPGIILMPMVITMYVNLLAGADKVGGKAYGYVFDHVPEGWKKEGAVACHAMESPYVFGDFDYKNSDAWRIVSLMAKGSGAKSADPGLTETDIRVSELMMTMWTNFARTGDPSIPGVVDWPAWDEAKDQYLYITDKPEVRSGFSKIGPK